MWVSDETTTIGVLPSVTWVTLLLYPPRRWLGNIARCHRAASRKHCVTVPRPAKAPGRAAMGRYGTAMRSLAALGAAGLACASAMVVLADAPAAAPAVNDESSFRTAWNHAAVTQIVLAAASMLACVG